METGTKLVLKWAAELERRNKEYETIYKILRDVDCGETVYLSEYMDADLIATIQSMGYGIKRRYGEDAVLVSAGTSNTWYEI